MEHKIIQNIPLDRLVCEPQVRERFDEETLVGLAQSIREVGLLQPLLVRRDGDRLVVVEGHRRVPACRKAGKTEVPVIIDDRELDGVEVTLRQLVVNSQREDLTPMERAKAYARLIEESGWSAAEVARRTGVSEATVSRLTALLTLTPDVIRQVESGEIPASTAYQIAIAGDATSRSQLADEVANSGLTRDRVIERTRARKPRPSARPRRVRVVVPVGDGCSITARPGVTLQAFVSRLRDLLSRFSGLEPQIELVDAVKALVMRGEVS